jgi:hypothetical protein
MHVRCFFSRVEDYQKLNVSLRFQRSAFAALGGYFLGAGNMLYRSVQKEHPSKANASGAGRRQG